ncbi:MAG: hypothetical protein ACRERE_10880 [Candidatus Entotheonellia bacterium]
MLNIFKAKVMGLLAKRLLIVAPLVGRIMPHFAMQGIMRGITKDSILPEIQMSMNVSGAIFSSVETRQLPLILRCYGNGAISVTTTTPPQTSL